MEFHEGFQDLIEIHDRLGVVHKPVDLDELYESDPEQTVSFEIAFTAFIATVTLAAPMTGTILDLLIPWAGGGLLLLTIIRRIALDNVFIEPEKIFQSTLAYVIYLVTFSVIYLALSLAGFIEAIFGFDTYVLTSIILITVVFGSLLIYEYFFHDLMFWGAVTFYNEAVDRTNDYNHLMRVAWIAMAQRALTVSMINYNEEHYVIKRINDIDVGNEADAAKIVLVFLYTIFLLILLVIVGLFAFLLSWITGMSLLAAFLINISLLAVYISVVGFIQFIYSRYGSANINSVRSNPGFGRLIIMMYSIILLHAGFIDQIIELL